jgi:hypothetical protein
MPIQIGSPDADARKEVATKSARSKRSVLALPPEDQAFAEVVDMIQTARGRALASVNAALVDLYWRLGEYISRKLETASWGEGVVDELASYIQRRHPNFRGFTRRNLFRMRQFFGSYARNERVSASTPSAARSRRPWSPSIKPGCQTRSCSRPNCTNFTS